MQYKHYNKSSQVAINVVGAIALLSLSAALPTASFAAKKITAVSQPQVTMMLEPMMANGQMRLYTVPAGVSYWTGDLPIYQGDKVKLDIFVATGADQLQELKVRLDNQPIADITQAPWNTTLDTDKLGAGYHFLEAWAYVSGPKPEYVTRTLTFFVSPASAAAATEPVTQVKGQEQILNNGQVTNVPLPGSDTSIAPALPAPIANATEDDAAKVTLSLHDADTKAIIYMTQTPQVSSPAVVSVLPTPDSTAKSFVYSLVSGGQTILDATQSVSIDTTEIRLQPRTATTPGLLPGTATVWVWGVDSHGNYGKPVSATVQIATQAGE